MALQLAFVLVAIIIGARLGGIGLGVMGGIIKVRRYAASCMQAAGGLTGRTVVVSDCSLHHLPLTLC